MPFISVTRLLLRSMRCFPAFLWLALLSGVQAKRAPGNLKAAGLRDSHLTFWTLTAWSDENAMRAFMLSGPHQHAMPKLFNWCDEASVVHWNQETAELASWSEAHRRMVEDGRQSRVQHPSASPRHSASRIGPLMSGRNTRRVPRRRASLHRFGKDRVRFS
jgi:hypothetical protein